MRAWRPGRILRSPQVNDVGFISGIQGTDIQIGPSPHSIRSRRWSYAQSPTRFDPGTFFAEQLNLDATRGI